MPSLEWSNLALNHNSTYGWQILHERKSLCAFLIGSTQGWLYKKAYFCFSEEWISAEKRILRSGHVHIPVNP